MADMLVVQSKVKDAITAAGKKKGKDGFRTSATALDALSAAVDELIMKAVNRAIENGRSTVKDCDI